MRWAVPVLPAAKRAAMGGACDAAGEAAENIIRDDIVRTCRRLVELGLNSGSAGNVGVRCGDRMLLTPSGIPYDELSGAQIAVMDGRGRYHGPCLLANHGLLVIGTTLAQALRRTIEVETLARQYVYAAQLGEPVILPPAEIDRVARRLRTYGTQNSTDADLVRVASFDD